MNLIEKLKNMKEDTKKRILATALAGSMVAGSIPMASCTPKDNSTETNYSSTTNQNGSHNSADSSGSSSTNNKYANYSTILQNVMTKSIYDNLVGWGLRKQNDGSISKVKNSNCFLPIPYKFLEDLGYDTNQVYNDKYEARSEVFRIDNDLYIALGIQALSKENYMTNYLLKYNITDQEIEEMNKLFYTRQSTYYNYTYFQAPFFVQELSYHKIPEVLNVSHQSMDTQKTIDAGLHLNSCTTSEYSHVIMLNFRALEDSEIYYYNCIIWPKSTRAHSTTDNLGLIELYSMYGPSWNAIQNIEGNEILNLTYVKDAYNTVNESKKSQYKTGENRVSADIYSSSDRIFNDIRLNNCWEQTFNEENPFKIN